LRSRCHSNRRASDRVRASDTFGAERPKASDAL
jgi:hypothetical protein